MCRLEPGGFVGSMAFNRFIQEPPPASSHTAARGTADASPAGDEGKDQAGSVFIEGLVVGDGGYKYGGKGVLDLVKDAVFGMLRGDSVVGNVALSLVPDAVDGRKDLGKMECTKNTVTATSDVSCGSPGVRRVGELLTVSFSSLGPIAGFTYTLSIAASNVVTATLAKRNEDCTGRKRPR